MSPLLSGSRGCTPGFGIAAIQAAGTGRFVETENEKTTTVRLRFAPSVATYISERTWHPRQQLKHRRDGSIEMSLPVKTFAGITSWILGFGDDVEVLAPKSLRNSIVSCLVQTASQYGAGCCPDCGG